MRVTVSIKPEMLRWACERAGDSVGDLHAKYPRLVDWISGEAQPTLKQLREFANAARVSLGYLFLPEPPDEKLPISDLRTVASQGVRKPSPDLLDTIYTCQRRQDWYRDYSKAHLEGPREFVGSVTPVTRPTKVALDMQRVIDFDLVARAGVEKKEDAFSLFIERVESAGVLVMVNGIVGNNPNRKLDPEEFRGFALSDEHAPLVFINGSDAPSARMFTLAHELAHIWLGNSALSDSSINITSDHKIEAWCNRVAAEFLVPTDVLKRFVAETSVPDVGQLAATFKVSRLVILRRLLDAELLTRPEFDRRYRAELEKVNKLAKPKKGGGDFYRTLQRRVGKRFARALVTSTLEGETLYRDAFQMLGVKSESTFSELGKILGHGE